jgi:anti-sigma B factor antagonist
MPEPSINVDVRITGATASVLAIRGDLTAASEDVLTNAYEQACTEATRSVLLDFAGLEYLNSGGIGLLVTLLVRANREQRKLIGYGISSHHRDIFRLTRLDEAMEIHNSEQEAVAAAGE